MSSKKTRVNLAPLDDEHNVEPIRLVAPVDHVNPNPPKDFVYDLIAIGAGAGGLVSSKQSARRGFKSALVEFNLSGGDCLNYGCVPSKAILRCAAAVKEVRRSEEFGISVSNVNIDFKAVMKRMRKLRLQIAPADSYEGTIATGADMYQGRAKFTSPNTMDVDGQTLRFRKAVIATGASPRVPDIKGLDQVPYLTNETLFHLTEQPEHMLVVGAGPIGLEMAQAFAILGTKITVVSNSLLPREDPDAAEIVRKSLEADGVEFVLHSHVEYVKKADSDKSKIEVCCTVGDTNQTFVCDALMIATGRVPNVKNLGLEEAGVKYTERRGVEINDYLQTSNPDIYAVGDITPKHKFTHLSGKMAMLVVENALFGFKHKYSDILLPWVTYTHPEVAHVGKYEHEVDEPVDVYTTSLEHNDRAILEGANEGFFRVVCLKGTDKIIGGTIVAENAGEMISELTLAVQFNIGLGSTGLGKVIHSYPTVADGVGGCAFQYKAKHWKYRTKDGKIEGGE